MRLCTRKLFCLVGGLFGSCSFAFYAASTHIDGFFQNLAPIFLGHAIILFVLAISPFQNYRFPKLVGYSMIVGVLLFGTDLLFRQFLKTSLFPYAAPIGGMIIIFSWFCLGFCGLLFKAFMFEKK